MGTSASVGGRRRRAVGLVGLPGFEAGARMLSFTKAAAELNLAQSSISRQIAMLERLVGKALFVRRTRALDLTAAGTQLQRAVRQALAAIDQSVDDIRGASSARRMTLTTYASFASLWLVEELAQPASRQYGEMRHSRHVVASEGGKGFSCIDAVNSRRIWIL